MWDIQSQQEQGQASFSWCFLGWSKSVVVKVRVVVRKMVKRRRYDAGQLGWPCLWSAEDIVYREAREEYETQGVHNRKQVITSSGCGLNQKRKIHLA